MASRDPTKCGWSDMGIQGIINGPSSTVGLFVGKLFLHCDHNFFFTIVDGRYVGQRGGIWVVISVPPPAYFALFLQPMAHLRGSSLGVRLHCDNCRRYDLWMTGNVSTSNKAAVTVDAGAGFFYGFRRAGIFPAAATRLRWPATSRGPTSTASSSHEWYDPSSPTRCEPGFGSLCPWPPFRIWPSILRFWVDWPRPL